MKVVELICDLERRQISLWHEDGRLRFRAPKGALDTALKATLTAHKPEIVAWLVERDAVAAGRARSVPVSQGQQGMWLEWQLDPGSSHAHIVTTARLCDDVDLDALGRAAQAVLDAHPALRTSFAGDPADDRRALGTIHRERTVEFTIADGSIGDVEAWRAAQMDRPFDLSAGPIMRLAVLGPDSGRPWHELIWTVHHIASDYFSQEILQAALDAEYRRLTIGGERAIPSGEALSHHDFVRWERDVLRSDGERLARFWADALDADAPPLEWPAPMARPAAAARPSDALTVDLDPGLVAPLRALARRCGVTLNVALLAAWQVLLARSAGQHRFMIITPITVRDLPGWRSTVGYFVNPLIVVADLSGQPSFTALLAAVSADWQRVVAHRHHPFPLMLRHLHRRMPLDGLGRLAEFVFVARRQKTPLDGLYTAVSNSQRGTTQDIGLTVIDDGDALRARFAWRTAAFDRPAIERMAVRLDTLLRAITADPGRAVDRLAVLPPAERRQVCVDWNATRHSYPREAPVHRLFEARAAERPDAVAALVDRDDGSTPTITYAALNARANRLARGLRSLGVGTGARVGLCAERGIEMLVGMLGILKAGGAYVPLGPDDPAPRRAQMLADAAPTVVVTLPPLRARIPASPAQIIALDDETFADEDPRDLPAAVGADGLAYVMYTSGSTGRPKGVEITHRGVVRLVVGTDHARFGPRDRVLQVATPTFDAATTEIWGALLGGGRLVLPAPGPHGPRALARLVARHRITSLDLTTGLFHLMADDPPAGLETLRQLFVGGDVLSPAHARRMVAALPECRVVNAYGPTENTTTTTWHRLTVGGRFTPSVPIGRPVANTRVYVLDDAGQPVPIGAPGELYAAGDGVARGYLNRPALTAERFPAGVPGLDEPGPLYRTGDRARWLPDGTIEFLGRVDSQVKIRGFRVEAGEVEAAIARHDAVRTSAVVAPADAAGARRLVAWVVPRAPVADEARATEALRAHLEAAVPGYMVPSAFGWLDALPVSPAGKVDRAALTVRPVDARGPTPTQAPQTATERLLAGIWRDLLGRAIGRQDHFFHIGGHSLLAVRVLSRLRSRAGVDLPLRAAFDHPTLAGLAAEADRARATGAAVGDIPTVPRTGPLPLSPAQARLWFLDRMGLRPGVYTVPVAVRLSGTLDPSALDASLRALVARHESLRTVFPALDGAPTQDIRPADPHRAVLERVDLAGLDPDARAAEVRRRVSAEIEHPFDLSRGPLARATALRLDPAGQRHVLLLTVHHIVTDGWSMDIIGRELSALYAAAVAGEQEPALPPALQYADYAAWRVAEQRAADDRRLDWWAENLGGAPDVIGLPTDRPRPPVQTHAGAHHLFTLPATLLPGLEALSRAAGGSLFMTLLTAFEALLMRYTGERDIVVGTPVARRDHPATESLVGLLVDLLPVRCRATGDETFVELLARTRDAVLDAHRHDAPFDRIVDRLRPTRDPSHGPLFQVAFDMPAGDPLTLDLPGVTVEGFEPFDCPIAKLELTLSLIVEGPDVFAGRIEYSTDLFDRATIERMAGHLGVLLEGVVADPRRPVATLPLMPAAERHRVLVEWNDTGDDYPRDASIWGLFAAEAARRPEAVALVRGDPDGADRATRMTYGELYSRARRMAGRLRAAGVGPEGCVGLFVERSLEMVVAVLGVLAAGGAYLPLDPHYPRARLRFMLDDTRPTVVIADRHLVEQVPPSAAEVIPLDAMVDAIDMTCVASDDAMDGISGPHGDRLAYVMYTSGSSGRPKGIEVTQRNVIRLVRRIHYGEITADDVFLQSAPMAFDQSTLELWGPLLNGGRLVLPGPGRLALDRLSAIIEAQGVTFLLVAAGLFHVMVDEHLDALRPLRVLMPGGDVISPSHMRRAVDGLPGCQIINGYGPTENTTLTCCHTVTPGSLIEPTVPIGGPIGHTRVYVLDRDLRPTPIGVPGELCAAGDGVARGYLGRPALTAERFVTVSIDGVGPERVYRTGDRARWRADGTLEFMGRLDEQVKIRGFRIEPGEVEAVIDQHPGVQSARVITRRGVDGQRRLVAYVVFEDSGDPMAIDALRRALERTLPDYMVPQDMVALDALPLAANGKLDRAALPAPTAAQRPTVAPRGPIEEQVAGIWRAVLDVPRVSADDNFFDLGGNSLLLLRVHSRLRALRGDALSVTDLFRFPTVATLAAHLAGADAAPQLVARRPIRRDPAQRARRQRARRQDRDA